MFIADLHGFANAKPRQGVCVFCHNCFCLLALWGGIRALASLPLLNVLSQLDTVAAWPGALSLCRERARWRLFLTLLPDCRVALRV